MPLASFLVPTYKPRLSIAYGKGSYLWSQSGEKYLDFTSGIGVCNLGHSQINLINALEKQAHKLWHISNLFSHPLQEKLAKEIIQNSFSGKVFFANSGTEANEGLLKLIKKANLGKKREEIICLKNSFHGRTLGSLSVTGQDKYRCDFQPLIPNIKHIEPNFKDFIQTYSPKTAAFFVELVQGEGGVNILDKSFIQKTYEFCQKNNILFIVDEIQTGMGRTGEIFSFKHYNIQPDAFSLAKALANGIPIGAFVVKNQYANILERGSHASTFGGNPLACSVSLKVFEIIKNNNILEEVKQKAKFFEKRFDQWRKEFSFIKKIKQLGFMIGLDMEITVDKLIARCQDKKLLVLSAGSHTLRLLPPLNSSIKEIEEGLDIIETVLKTL